MTNGKVFNTGNNPPELLIPLMHLVDAGFALEFVTASGKPVVLEMWAFPSKDAAVTAFYKTIEAQMNAPTRMDAASLDGVAAIFIPGGHGAMINAKNADLGKVRALPIVLPTVACGSRPRQDSSAKRVLCIARRSCSMLRMTKRCQRFPSAMVLLR